MALKKERQIGSQPKRETGGKKVPGKRKSREE